jgi:hypothetical protein
MRIEYSRRRCFEKESSSMKRNIELLRAEGFLDKLDALGESAG